MSPKSSSHYPHPRQEIQLRRKMWFFVGVIVSIIVVSWLIFLPYSIKKMAQNKDDSMLSGLGDSTRQLTELLEQSREKASEVINILEQELQKGKLNNSNQSSETNGNTNSNLSEEQRQELEQEVFPQFESSQ